MSELFYVLKSNISKLLINSWYSEKCRKENWNKSLLDTKFIYLN